MMEMDAWHWYKIKKNMVSTPFINQAVKYIALYKLIVWIIDYHVPQTIYVHEKW